MSGMQSIPAGTRLSLFKVFILCLISAGGNALTSYFTSDIARLPLYLDTIFTVAVCFSLGLRPALLVAVVLNPLLSVFFIRYLQGHSIEAVLTGRIFTICTVVEVFLVFYFHKRFKKQETVFLKNPSLNSFITVAAFLLTLAAFDCILISISGGIIDFILTKLSAPRSYFPEDTFKLGLLRNNVPVLASAVFSRIPINIVDRFIAVFCGYGISLFYRKISKIFPE